MVIGNLKFEIGNLTTRDSPVTRQQLQKSQTANLQSLIKGEGLTRRRHSPSHLGEGAGG